ncbi:MAG: phosphoglycerate dehydrogenase, partial [Sandaracinaceae bacterium]|nr:phosphoglycerate dehydrogenase [Sandaracinaceae bacterium]
IGAFCIGTNQIALGDAHTRGIPAFNAPFSNTRSVAELVMSEVVALSRRLTDRCAEMHQGRWTKSAEGCREVRGKTLGIVGYGHIGRQVGVLAELFGLNVVFHDIVSQLPMGNNKVASGLAEVLETADFVTLHVPATPQTANMIGAAELALMKPSACLLNLSRGNVVVIEALADAIGSGRLAGAAIDVFPVEPRSNEEPFESALRGLPNVILTPHVGGSTEEAQIAIGVEVATAVTRYLQKGTTLGAVNFPLADLSSLPKTHRIQHLHKNVPGVLGDVHRICAAHTANVLGQVLVTDPSLGYLLMDLEDDDPAADITRELAQLKTTLFARQLY